jgi:rRNA maturation protein Nop10
MKPEQNDQRYVLFEWKSKCGAELRIHGRVSPGSGTMSSVACPLCGELTNLPTPPLRVYVKKNDEWVQVQQ